MYVAPVRNILALEKPAFTVDTRNRKNPMINDEKNG